MSTPVPPPAPNQKHRVTVYYMHEYEEAEAVALFPDALERTPSFSFGEADDATIEALRKQGLVVSVRGAQGTEPWQTQGPLLGTMQTGGAPIPPAGVASAIGTPFAPAAGDDEIPGDPDDYVLVIDGPLLPSTTAALAAAGAVLHERLALGTYRAGLHRADVQRTRALPFVTGLTWTGSIAPTVQAAPLAGAQRGPGASTIYDVALADASQYAATAQWLAEHGITLVGNSSSMEKLRVEIRDGAPELDALRRLAGVMRMEAFVPPTLFNDRVRALVGIVPAAGAQAFEFDGSGEIIAIADTGIDATHPDFAGRLKKVIARGSRPLGDDPHGHGTHVAGTAAGDGNADGGKFAGAAPGAEIVFQALLDSHGGLGGLPIDYRDLFAQAYAEGARIHNNSWGVGAVMSEYVLNSQEVDDFVVAHPDMLIVVAAGNTGSSTGTRQAQPGWIDWLSISAPATCKNAVTVGASQSDRTDGPIGTWTWQQFDGIAFAVAPTSTEMATGQPESLAAFSSRGPCTDRRIKPDLVAPGTDVCSTRSSIAQNANFSGLHPSGDANAKYAFDSGTSMAAPLVAGSAALVRQFYRTKKNYATPSAALIKATLVGGARRLTGADACAPATGAPNFHQGHGRVDVRWSLEQAGRPGFTIFYDDSWTAGQGLAKTGDRARFQVTLGAPGELRVCLAYTDLPGRALQNDLNLLVQRGGDPQKFVGNAELPDGLLQLDMENNLELVRIPNAQPGIYYIQVTASNVLRGPVSFALYIGAEGLTNFGPY